MEIIKPYEYDNEEWNSAWEVINGIDMIAEYKEEKVVNLSEFMSFLENKYKNGEGELFDMINLDDFSMYLKLKYNNARISEDIRITTYLKFD